MAWVTPKIDWVPAYGITHTDFNRIEGDQIELKKAATIDITDAAGYYTTKNVEFALERLKKWVLGLA